MMKHIILITLITLIFSQKRGVDVSSYQKDIQWDKVKEDDIHFAIIRSTLRDGKLDPQFNKYYEGATKQNITVGFYHLCFALTPKEASDAAENLINKLQGKKGDIFLGLEWSELGKLPKANITAIAGGFIDKCHLLGYNAHFFSNKDWHLNKYNPGTLIAKGSKEWLFDVGNNTGKYDPSKRPNLGEFMWLYTTKGKVNGISNEVNLNMMYEHDIKGSNYFYVPKKIVVINPNGVNIRNQPSFKSDVVGWYSKGSIVDVKGISDDGEWFINQNDEYFSSNKYAVYKLI